MTHPSAASGNAGGRASGGWTPAADDGWGPATRSTARPAVRRPAAALNAPSVATGAPAVTGDGWDPAGPRSARDQRDLRRLERAASPRPGDQAAYNQPRAAVRERGLPWWAALLILIAITAVGGVVDTIGTEQARGGSNIGIVVASLIAILVVRRSHLFPVVIAPPIVYSAAVLFQLYLRSSGLHDKKVVLDAAANYLVYGFPAIAAATAAVLIIAGIRLIIRK